MNVIKIKKTFYKHPFIYATLLTVLALFSSFALYGIRNYWYPPVTSLDASELARAVMIHTNKGNIVVTLDGPSPFAIAQFTRFVRNNFYTNNHIHRIVPNLLFQMGDPLSKYEEMRSSWGEGGAQSTFKLETFKTDQMTRGTVAMADTGTNSYGSQFFIVTKDTPWLVGKATIIGHVTEGFETMDIIEHTPTDATHTPREDLIITTVTQL